MNSAKVALSMPADVLRLAKKEVAAGRAKSLSSFVAEAVDEKLRRDELTSILDAMDAEYGAPTKDSAIMGKARPRTTVVLDAGALIAFERSDARMRALVREALKADARIVIPAGVLGQVWRGSARQAPLRAIVKGPTTSVPVLDQVLAEAAGVLCGRAGTSDVVDAFGGSDCTPAAGRRRDERRRRSAPADPSLSPSSESDVPASTSRTREARATPRGLPAHAAAITTTLRRLESR